MGDWKAEGDWYTEDENIKLKRAANGTSRFLGQYMALGPGDHAGLHGTFSGSIAKQRTMGIRACLTYA